jgi:hypothetical protein
VYATTRRAVSRSVTFALWMLFSNVCLHTLCLKVVARASADANE